ncbi:hypothetical protein TSUD_100990 [Trifolium subterraneum]|uniref:Uncharacterized protein n=1 Tax=Trifolium subterraneum TaxID=3900 RepID=A0A2Z6PEX7_TRISU|nr:hypothetical protein TSUD_100990 [Trifolium subterraneum]
MASDIEFTVLTQKEADFIKTYFTIEHQFMPKQNFFNSAPNILFRRHAVSIIANEQVVECATKMFQLCRRMKIQIEIPESSVHSTSSKVLAYSSEEEEETALIRQKRKTGKTSGTYQVQVPVKAEKVMVVGISDKKGVARVEAENRSLSKGKEKAVEVTETSVDDKARVEAIIRRALENGKALVGEEPQTQIEGFNSEILELVAPKKLMIFELKWPTEVPPLELLAIKNALQEAEDEEEVEEELQIDDQGVIT